MIARTLMTDGRWFDASRATIVAGERVEWDGTNHISVATGSQWDHEQVWQTAKGQYVLRRWSQWQGSRPSYDPITPEQAAQWILAHGEGDLPGDLEHLSHEGEA